MTDKFNTLEQQNLSRTIGDQTDRIARLERMVSQLSADLATSLTADVSANRLNGGTLRAKNTTDGVKVSILDSGDVEIGTIDENGLIILNGNMSLENADGDVTIDDQGIVSMQNFFQDAAIASNNQVITSGTLVDVTDSELTTHNFTRSCQVLAMARIINNNGPVDDTMTAFGNFEFELQCDAQAVRGSRGFVYQVDAFGPGSHYTEGARTDTLTIFSMLDLPAGTHTIKVQAKTNPGDNMLSTVEEVHVGYIVLGT